MNALPPGGGLFASLRGLLATTVELLYTRVELLATEVEEEKLRLVGILLYSAAALMLFGIGAVFLAVFLTLLWWDSNRLLVVGGSALVFLLGGIAACLLARRQIRVESGLFSASLAELKQDRQALQADAGEGR